jgi:hypothetical protein
VLNGLLLSPFQLYSNGAPKKLVAKYHEQKGSGLFRRGNTHASLEVFLDPGTHDLPDEVLDMIIITFAYLESKRVDSVGTMDIGAYGA